MKEIKHYKTTWNAKKDEGRLILYTSNVEGSVEQIHMDSAAEKSLLIDILTNEKPVFYQDGLIFTGFGTAMATDKDKDNLRLIEGIGPKIEGLLNDAGIHTFVDLKTAKTKKLKAILEAAGNRYKMHDPSTWGKQAKLAAAGKMKELKEWQAKLDGGKAKK